MRKVTLAFPDDNSLWSFTTRTKATNISVRPRSNHISGLFAPDEINIATNELKAVVVSTQPGRASFPAIPAERKNTPLRQITRWLQSIDLRL